MISNSDIQTYRYPYAQTRRAQEFLAGVWSSFFLLNRDQQLVLAVLAAGALCLGTMSAYTVHAKTMTAQSTMQQIQSQNMALDTEHTHLLALRAKLSSRERITKIAAARLHLFEPGPDQVQQL